MNLKLLFIFLLLVFIPSNVSAYSISYNQTTEQIIFIPEINETINYNGSIYYSFPLNINFSNIENNKINLIFEMSDRMPPENYTGFITVLDGLFIQKINIYKVIEENINYSITPQTNTNIILNVENISLTEQKNILNITLQNKGNTDITFHFSIKNKSDVLFIQPNIMLQKFQNVTTPILATIPINYETGVFNDTLIVDDGMNITYINFSYMISDTILPKIIEFSITDTDATIPSQILVKASDNVGIDRVMVIINNPNNEDYTIKLDKGVDNYYGMFKDTDVVGAYTVKVIVYDIFENSIYNTTSINVFKLDVVNYSTHIDALPSIIPKFKLFELNKKLPITISFDKIDYRGNWSVIIQTPFGQELSIKNINDSVNISNPGIYYMMFHGDLLSNVSDASAKSQVFGILNLTTIDQHVLIDPITFSTTLVTYSLPSKFTIDIGEMKGTCTPSDGGNLETSKVMCSLEYPPDITKYGLSLPITEDMYHRIVTDRDKDVYKLTSDKNKYNLHRWLLSFTMIFMLVGIVVYYWVIPRHTFN